MPNSASEQRKLAAIMFTDMVGYSALAQRNEALALELLEEHRRIVRNILPGHGGREVKTTGDGFLIEFPSVLAAVQCALAVQHTLHERNQAGSAERQVRVRIGIHVGDVVVREGDIHGDGVNIAARLEPLAEPGGICLSDTVVAQVRNKLDLGLTKLDSPALKNIEAPLDVYRVVLPWEQPSRGRGEAARSATSEVRTSKPRRAKSLITAAARSWVLLTALGLVAVGVGWWQLHQRRAAAGKRAGRITSLAVKPLDDFSGDTNQAYLSDGMTEALCSALGNVSALRVPGRSTVMRFKGGRRSIQEMAKELNVDAIVEGSVQRAANRALITVQLVEAASDRHLWATNYQRDLSDFFKVQTEVAQAIAAEIQVRLSPQDEARLARARPVNPPALEAYLKGRLYWNRWTEDEGKKALDYFRQATERDPKFALAYAGLADAYWQLADVAFPAHDAMPKAKKAAEQALALDDSLAEACTALAVVRLFYDYDWSGAEQDFIRAIALNPGYATAHHQYGWLLAMRGRFAEAAGQMQRAAELEPLSPVIVVDGNVPLTLTRQYDKAMAKCRNALEIDPGFYLAHFVLGWIELVRGNATAAVPQFQTAAATEPAPWILAWLGHAQAVSGNPAEAQKLLTQLDQLATTKARFVTSQCQAVIYLGLGDTRRTLEWLEKAYEARSPWLTWLKVEPLFDPLRAEPEFKALVRKVGLDQ